MLQLTYISSAAPNLPDTAIADILKTSRRNNILVGLTGLLLHDGRRFLQALEGEASMLERTYDRIKADPRHRAIVLLSSREVERRDFGDWAMAAQQVADAADGTVADLVDRLTADVPDASMRELFRSFARLRNAA